MARPKNLIISRFNKHPEVRDKYLTGDGENLLHIARDQHNFAIVTDKLIKGAWQGQDAIVKHSTGDLQYKMIKSDGSQVLEKSDWRGSQW